MQITIYAVLAALKKNFRRLYQCVPLNLSDKLKRCLPIDIQNTIRLPPSADPLKDNIQFTVSLMAITIKSDKEVLKFLDTLEEYTDHDASKAVIEILRDGKFLN